MDGVFLEEEENIVNKKGFCKIGKISHTIISNKSSYN
jgi:hypothetical protein